MIKAIPLLNKRGIRVRYHCIGGGDSSYLQNFANRNHVSDQVVFTGRLEHDSVLNYLDDIDLYIQPSLQEGLPRALIEAMNRGCPALGSAVGGIPELLSIECLFKKASPESIEKVLSCALSSDSLRKMSERSFKIASDYYSERLNERRGAFFKDIASSIKLNEDCCE